ncbi:MAG: hypothetical protein JO179_14860, partial [Solirubrobacterales bacterium]|nr:hypothetical protein [Solirubrobacterales bacterium]
MKTILSSRAIRAIVPGVLAPLLFVVAFVVPAHDPKPNGLPIAVAGPPAAARQLLRPLGDVKVVDVADAESARDAVRDGDVYGAIVVSARPTVYIASGASYVFASILRQDALRAGMPSEQIHDLASLPAGDPRGTILNLVALALLITSITGAALAIVHMPDLTAGRREASVASIATLAGLGTTGILKALHALPGPFLGEAA